jgi:hypothetical protein
MKKLCSFEDFRKRVASQRIDKAANGTAKKKKCEELKEVLINVGMRKYAKGELRPAKGKGMLVRVYTNVRKAELLKKSIEKHAAHNQHFDEYENYAILYPDGTEILTLPDQATQLFQLDHYMEDVGKPYNRISFFLIERSLLEETKGDSSDEDKYLTSPFNTKEKNDREVEIIEEKSSQGTSAAADASKHCIPGIPAIIIFC